MQQRLPQLLTLEARKQKLKCPNKIQAFSACIDPQCLVAGLMCRDSTCQCIKAHYKCHHIQLDRVLDSIERHQKQLPQEVRKSYKATYQIINEMIDQLSKILRKLDLQQKYFGLTEQELSFMTLIDEQKIDKICGKIVNQLEKTFQAEISFMIKTHEQIIRNFTTQRKHFDSLCKHIESFYTKYNPKENIKTFLNSSKIVNQSDKKETINKWLSDNSNINNFESKLIFRASEHNFSASQFHKRCDEFQNTLVIVKTEFDKVIGGFTPNKWQYQRSQSYVKDETGKTFLFSLTLNEKYKCTNPQKSINCYKNCGPIFGGGHDLLLTDNAHINNSYANFSHSYNLLVNGANKYANNQQAYTLFSGSAKDNLFKVKQYEVYEIKGM